MSIYTVTGYTQYQGVGYCPATRTNYELVVEFSTWKDNKKVLNEYLRWYCGVDFERDSRILYQIQTDENCAAAIVTYFMRDKHEGFHDRRIQYTSIKPEIPHVVEVDTYRLWIVKEEKQEVMTEMNAAWELYERCNWGKVSIADAKDILRSKFPQNYFKWSDVLYEFERFGGKYTKLYLRRD